MSFSDRQKNVHICLKIHFFTKLMVREAFSRFGKWRNRFLDAKNGVYALLGQKILKNLIFFYCDAKCTSFKKVNTKKFIIHCNIANKLTIFFNFFEDVIIIIAK